MRRRTAEHLLFICHKGIGYLHKKVTSVGRDITSYRMIFTKVIENQLKGRQIDSTSTLEVIV
jgi:hypothetical protein